MSLYGEIYAAAFAGEPWNDPWRPEDAQIHVRELLETKTAYGLEYVEDGKVVGFLVGTSMLFHYGRTFEINDLDNPTHRGFHCFRWLLERFSPRFFLHGHVHRRYGVNIPQRTEYGQTVVYNTCGYVIFDYEKDAIKA